MINYPVKNQHDDDKDVDSWKKKLFEIALTVREINPGTNSAQKQFRCHRYVNNVLVIST